MRRIMREIRLRIVLIILEAFEDAIIPTSVNLPPEATPLGRFMKKALDNPVSNFVQEKASDVVGFLQKEQPKNKLNFLL